MGRKKPSEQEIAANLGITYEEVYAALTKVGRSCSIANVKELRTYLETTARDAAATALVDWQEQNKPEA